MPRNLLVVAAIAAGGLMAFASAASAVSWEAGLKQRYEDANRPTPPCAPQPETPSGDETICMYITNQLLAWSDKPSSSASQASREFYNEHGPKLTGKSRVYMPDGGSAGAGGYKDGYGRYWAGPACAAGSRAGLTITPETPMLQANAWPGPSRNDSPSGRNACAGESQGFKFGTRRQVQFDDWSYSASSGRWKVAAKVNGLFIGEADFYAANNGGTVWGDDPHGAGSLYDWTSFSRTYTDGGRNDRGQVNTNTVAGNDVCYYDTCLSAGFYLKNFPIAVKVANELPGSRIRVLGVGGSGVRRVSAASTMITGSTATAGTETSSLWGAGLRKRDGGTAQIEARIEAVDSANTDAWNGARVTIAVPFADGSKASDATCRIDMPSRGGESAQCVAGPYRSGSAGEVGVATFAILP